MGFVRWASASCLALPHSRAGRITNSVSGPQAGVIARFILAVALQSVSLERGAIRAEMLQALQTAGLMRKLLKHSPKERRAKMQTQTGANATPSEVVWWLL